MPLKPGAFIGIRLQGLLRKGRSSQCSNTATHYPVSTGTAGLRGKMGPGYNRMNHVVVQQTAQGLYRWGRSVAGRLQRKDVFQASADGKRKQASCIFRFTK